MSGVNADILRQMAQEVLAQRGAPPMSPGPVPNSMAPIAPAPPPAAPVAPPAPVAPLMAAPVPVAPAPVVNLKAAERGVPVAAMPMVSEGINNAFGAADQRMAQARGVNFAGMSDTARQNDEVRQSEMNAANAMAGVETQKQDMLRQVYDEYLAKADAIDQKQAEIQQVAQQQLQGQMAKVETAAAEVQNFQLHSYFDDKGTFGRVLGLIAAACGGGANGLAGQPGAPTPLDRIIEQDMQLQMGRLGQKKASLEAQTGVLGRLREQTGDLMGAQLAYRNAIDQKLKVTIDQVGTKLGTPAAKLAEMKAQIDARAAERNQKASQFYLGNITNTLERDAAIQPQKAALGVELAKHFDMLQLAESKASSEEKTGLAGIAGSENLDGTTKEKLRSMLAQTQSAVGAIDELLADKSAFEAITRDPARRARLIESIRFPLTGSERALSETQKKLIQDIVGGQWQQFNPANGKAYTDNLREVRAAIMNAMRYQVKQNTLRSKPLPIGPDSFLYVPGVDN